jgi:hypothetical protein
MQLVRGVAGVAAGAAVRVEGVYEVGVVGAVVGDDRTEDGFDEGGGGRLAAEEGPDESESPGVGDLAGPAEGDQGVQAVVRLAEGGGDMAQLRGSRRSGGDRVV